MGIFCPRIKLSKEDIEELDELEYQPEVRYTDDHGGLHLVCIGCLNFQTKCPGRKVFIHIEERSTSPLVCNSSKHYYEDFDGHLLPLKCSSMTMLNQAHGLVGVTNPIIPAKFLATDIRQIIPNLRAFCHAGVQHYLKNKDVPFDYVKALNNLYAVRRREEGKEPIEEDKYEMVLEETTRPRDDDDDYKDSIRRFKSRRTRRKTTEQPSFDRSPKKSPSNIKTRRSGETPRRGRPPRQANDISGSGLTTRSRAAKAETALGSSFSVVPSPALDSKQGDAVMPSPAPASGNNTDYLMRHREKFFLMQSLTEDFQALKHNADERTFFLKLDQQKKIEAFLRDTQEKLTELLDEIS